MERAVETMWGTTILEVGQRTMTNIVFQRKPIPENNPNSLARLSLLAGLSSARHLLTLISDIGIRLLLI